MTDHAQRPTHLVVGRIVGTHGIDGTVRVSLISDFPLAFRKRKQLFVGEDLRPFDVALIRVTAMHALVDLVGVDTIEAAGVLRDELIYVSAADAVRPRHGEYFWHQIVGLRAETEKGRVLGTVTEILRTGANDVYVLNGQLGEVLVPAIGDVVLKIDVRGGRMVVRPLPGMLPGDD